MILKSYPLFIFVLAIADICVEIGTITIPIGNAAFILLPMMFNMVIGSIAYLIKPFRLADSRYEKISESILYISITIIIAKLGWVAAPCLPL
ncbi:MAG: DUF3100 domain-containing protein [Eggerthellaceae bacterium]|nr:DUF3100 domain-containing protein [Eggerthellaceae bacterium]